MNISIIIIRENYSEFIIGIINTAIDLIIYLCVCVLIKIQMTRAQLESNRLNLKKLLSHLIIECISDVGIKAMKYTHTPLYYMRHQVKWPL